MLLNNFMWSVRSLLLLLGMAALAGCATPHAGNDQSDHLTAAQWELIKWSQQPMPPVGVRPIILRFDQNENGDEGRVSGHAGCNQFSAPYVLRDANEITIATPVATRMACAPEVMDFEARLLDKLESISSYKITRNTMDLTAADGHVLSFRARAKVGAQANIKFIYVAPQQIACAADAAAMNAHRADQPQAMCFQVRENQDEPWHLWSGGIAGFDYEPGTAYRLRILEERVTPRVADAGSLRWTLDLIVEQETLDSPK
ncbi:MAG: hslJ [Herbaspirillum sp.]|jgi:heat shock protein HslJ|nr:hslJ [Herbaspirillum sp.]